MKNLYDPAISKYGEEVANALASEDFHRGRKKEAGSNCVSTYSFYRSETVQIGGPCVKNQFLEYRCSNPWNLYTYSMVKLIKVLMEEAKGSKIAILSLPPLGEDLSSRANV